MDNKEQSQVNTQNPIQIDTAPVNSPKGRSKISKSLIAIVVLVIIILALGGVMLFSQNKNVEKASENVVKAEPTTAVAKKEEFKTYTNTKYNYSIVYPGNWGLVEFDDKDGGRFIPADTNKESVSIKVGKKVGNYINETLEEYVKVAGAEIQNYGENVSLKKITTNSGIVGYEATYMIQSVRNNNPSESLPIAFFEVPEDKTVLVRVSLDNKEDLDSYEKMLKTFKIPANLNVTPTKAKAEDNNLIISVIKKQIALKHKTEEASLIVNVSEVDGDFAKGSVSDDFSGGMWFAQKEDGVWKLVWDGNGIIECSTFDLYPNFSKTMIPQCYDAKIQDIVNR
jgi:hypothetical protein